MKSALSMGAVLKGGLAASFVSMPIMAAAQAAPAQGKPVTAPVLTNIAQASSVTAPAPIARFMPKGGQEATRINYDVWDEVLDYFVLEMGPSLREGAPSVEPGSGTSVVYGHDSRFRLEGNRVLFSYFDDDATAALTAYRKDLERTASLIEITELSRNEQLAFWINLHNVAVIEQIAIAYPLSQPSRMKIGPDKLPLDEARFINISGVSLSPRDIRTRIVFPNWSDARVIYGFFRGDIGSPSIQDEAFTGNNVSALLDRSGSEFVNSLRGVSKRGSRMDVSKIYAEAAPFFFKDFNADLRKHLEFFANEPVTEIMAKTSSARASVYENDIADLAKGERDPNYSNVQTNSGDGDFETASFRVPIAIQRLLAERQSKVNKMLKRGVNTGTVRFVDIDLPDEDAGPEQVD